MKLKFFIIFNSSSSKSIKRIGISCSKFSRIFFKVLTSFIASLSLVVSAFFSCFNILLVTISKSARINSVLIISTSLIGSVAPSTWVIPASSKHLTTSTIASTSLIWDKNLFPKPSPFEAPFTKPAISVNS